jgi:tRNA dimethylallyltransferase
MVRPPPLLVLDGPTGVGKTAVAVRLARRLPIEAIGADSRQVYRGMDIGTGKPSAEERAALPHHLLDVVDPDTPYHAARFRREARETALDIAARGRLPVVVGGTGLYVRTLLKGLRPAPPAQPALRGELERIAALRGAPALHQRLRDLAPAAAARLHPNDRVRLVRALEIALVGVGDARAEPSGEWSAGVSAWTPLVIGLCRTRSRLNDRIAERVRDMVRRGIMEEVERLLEAGYDESLPSMGSIGYRQFCAVVRGRMGQDEAIGLMTRDTVRYAKRQMTWFARDPEIRWLDVDAGGGLPGVAEAVAEQVERERLIA